jgi:hypothetical protein
VSGWLQGWGLAGTLLLWRTIAKLAEPSNNAGPHHRAEKLSVAHADDFLADWVMIGADDQE